MIDMTKTIEPKSDQLNADDLIGGPRTITITKVSKSATPEQPISISFEGDNGKPYKPCKSMRRVLVHLWGADGSKYVGRSMTLFCDPKVVFGGTAVGGVRISHLSDIKEKATLALTVTKSKRAPYVVHPLAASAAKAPAPVVEIDPGVEASGREAAAEGVASYMLWLGTLEPSVKESIRSIHKELSAIAKKADEEKPKEEEIPFEDADGPAM